MFGEKRGSNDEEVIGADLTDDLDGKYEGGDGGDDDGDEEDEDEDDEDEVADLLKNCVAVGGQVYMIAGEDEA